MALFISNDMPSFSACGAEEEGEIRQTDRLRADIGAIPYAARRYAQDLNIRAIARGKFCPSRTDGILTFTLPDSPSFCGLVTERDGVVAGWTFDFRRRAVFTQIIWYPNLKSLPAHADVLMGDAPDIVANVIVPKVTGLHSLCHVLGLCDLPALRGQWSLPYNQQGSDTPDMLAERWHSIVDVAFSVFIKLH